MPAITILDLENAKRDVDHIAALATSTAPTATDRLGQTKQTIAGSLAAIAADVSDVQTARDTAINTDIPAAVALVNEAVALTAAGSATSARIAAEAARDAAFINADVKTDIEEGLATVGDGGQFQVVSVDGLTVTRYRRVNSTTATQVASYPAESAVGACVDAELPVVRNLYDSARADSGKYVVSDGSLSVNAGYFASSYLRIVGGQQYTFNAASHLAFYTAAKQFISYVNAPGTVTAPANARYLRFSHFIGSLTNAMVVPGASVPSKYLSFAYEDGSTAKRKRLEDSNARSESMLPLVRNLFDLKRAQDNYALGLTGEPYSASTWYITGKIPVVPGAVYVSNRGSNTNGASWYDENGGFLSTFTVTSDTSFTVPEKAYFFQQQANPLSNKSGHMVVRGASVPTSYLAFGWEDVGTSALNRMLTARSVTDASLPLGRNLFDRNRALDNTAVSPANGVTYSASGYFSTPLMPVVPGGYLYSTVVSITGAWFNQYGGFLSGITGLSAQPATVPAEAYFVRFQVYGLTNKESLVVTNQQTAPPGYLPFIGAESGARAWQGKKIDVLGDSISESALWIPYFTAGTGSVLQTNHAKAGRPVREMGKTAAGVVLQASDLTNTDLITVFGGTNDYGGNRDLGTIADAVTGNSATTFYADVFNLITLLYTLKPTVRVMFIAPLMRGAMSGALAGQPSYPAPNSTGATLQQYVQAIKDVCRLFSVPVCDLFSEGGLNLLNLSIYTSDNLHPNTAGTAVYVRRIISTANGI